MMTKFSFNLQKKLKPLIVLLGCLASLNVQAKTLTDFNFNWQFKLDSQDKGWQTVRLPHDWSVELPYTKDGAASTGFKLGGIGWYKKQFNLNEQDKNKVFWVEFDGIYNNSSIWINGHHVGGRPYGYTSFNVDITPYIVFDKANEIKVKVDRTAYADSRWYTGSGIYRNVRLVKANPVYIPQWGIQVTTPKVGVQNASVSVKTQLTAKQFTGDSAKVVVDIINGNGDTVSQSSKQIVLAPEQKIELSSEIKYPDLWSLEHPHLYQAQVKVYHKQKLISQDVQSFGVRSIEFDPNLGFFLNNKQVKIKGVNLHHDAGALGAAVPKSIWRSRLTKLKSIGVNAIRMAHNPHAPELLALCDEMGFLVNAEAFDDWDRAKAKSKVYLGDNQAKGESVAAYAEHFNDWAERDLKAMLKRDFNHPSIIMWSIGNEIEWTYPYYPKSVSHHEDGTSYYEDAPDFDQQRILYNIKKFNPDSEDNLAKIAHQLSAWVKEIDTTRPVTAGLTHPSVGFATGYADALDLVGFNYRAAAYQKAHETYPNKVIYGSENWGAWREWRDAVDKEYIAGIFIWTGFAYKGEAGPLPRMGLNISLFDFVGNKTPRGHFFETIWQDKAKIYLGTTPAASSEFSLVKTEDSEKPEWQFKSRTYPPHIWDKLRMWEWYEIEPLWDYAENEKIVVQSYTNTETAELFLNGKSLGKKALADFSDRVIKWMVPYTKGQLEVVGYNNNKAVVRTQLNTLGEIENIQLNAEKQTLKADQYDTVIVNLTLLDSAGNLVANAAEKVKFVVTGPAEILAVDNGSEFNIQDVLTDTLVTDRGRASVILRATAQAGEIKVKAVMGEVSSAEITLKSKSPAL